MSTQPSNQGRLARLVTNPWVVTIGFIFGVIGTIWGFYSYFAAKEYRQLSYYVNPARAVIVKADQSSNLKVSFGDQLIASDITAVQIQIWNAGNKAIEQTDILEPLSIQTENASILEASILYTSRPITKLSLNDSQKNLGKVEIDLNILEEKDGGVLQLIYTGTPYTKIILNGTIKGQKNFYDMQYINQRKQNYFGSIVFPTSVVVFGLFATVYGFFKFRSLIDNKLYKAFYFLVFWAIFTLIYYCYDMWNLYLSPTHIVPFEF